MPKRANNIYPLIYEVDNIKQAHQKARKDKSHYDAVKKTDEILDERAQEISEMLKNHTYKIGEYKTSRYSDRGKERILYKLPYYPDRII
jgi:DNA phosphorothioation-dependent restriction protein DptG